MSRARDWPPVGYARRGAPYLPTFRPTEREVIAMYTHQQWADGWRASAADERAQGNDEGADYGDYLADQNQAAADRDR